MAQARYDRIGTTYSRFRHTEPTWQAAINAALGDANTVLNVGAGTGNYEDLGPTRHLTALEPSRVMIDQRRCSPTPVVQASAEALPFGDDTFDATLGVLTMHHWGDIMLGLHELARVARCHVYVVFEPRLTWTFWLGDYFPEVFSLKREVDAPTAATIAQVLKVTDVATLWVPKDCRDGFATSSWARPYDYLDPDRQQSISTLALLDAELRAERFAQLEADLGSGAWHDRYGHLLAQERADFGYRLVTAQRE